jgi:hypothetical protein
MLVCRMLVDVITLRRNGEKIPRDELQAATPVRGHLRLVAAYAELSNEPIGAGGFHGQLLRPLLDAQVRKIDHRGLLIVGVERIDPQHLGIYLRQAWFARPVIRP